MLNRPTLLTALLIALIPLGAEAARQPEAQSLRDQGSGAPVAHPGRVAFPIPEGTPVEARPRLTVLAAELPEAMIGRHFWKAFPAARPRV